MIKLYDDFDFYNAYRQKRKLLLGFLGATGVWLAGFIAFVVYYSFLPYHDPNQTWVIAVTSILTAIYIAFLFPYMGICFKRSRAYCKSMKFLSRGIKECATAPFLEVDDWTTRDGVDVNVADFLVPNVKRDGMMVRQIYIDGEKDFPPFEEGDLVCFVTQGNLLVEYEIIKKHEASEENKE